MLHVLLFLICPQEVSVTSWLTFFSRLPHPNPTPGRFSSLLPLPHSTLSVVPCLSFLLVTPLLQDLLEAQIHYLLGKNPKFTYSSRELKGTDASWILAIAEDMPYFPKESRQKNLYKWSVVTCDFISVLP